MKKLFFVILIFIASFLRLWQLGEVPPSPDWDEASLGYNAYSIMTTGRDEYGKFMPIVLRSFDDYKPALYAYLTIPSIAVFGLNTFAVRLPSALLGVLTVAATYFLAKELFRKWEMRNGKLDNEMGIERKQSHFSFQIQASHIALLTSFLLAVSPWHIQFSRIAFESNIGLAFNILAILFFLRSFKKPWFLLISSFFMCLNLYTYQSEKVFTPLICLLLLIIFKKQLFPLPRRILASAIVIGFIVLLPMILYTATNKESLLARGRGVSIFSNPTEMLENSIMRLNNDQQTNDYLGQLLDNRRIVYAKKIVENYLTHFDLNWLFIAGDPKLNRHHAPQMGLLYLFELPAVLLGIYTLVFGEFSRKTKYLVLSWFLVAPIPASITMEVPHAVRTLNFLPTFQIFTAIGILSSWLWLRSCHHGGRYTVAIFIFAFGLANFVYYLNQYFVQQNYNFALDWQYGYRQAIDYIKPLKQKYKKIIVSNENEMSQSYIFFLFYLQYDPDIYLSEGGTSKQSFLPTKFSNFEFRPFDYPKEESKVLLIGSTKDFPDGIQALHTVSYPDKSTAIKIVEKN